LPSQNSVGRLDSIALSKPHWSIKMKSHPVRGAVLHGVKLSGFFELFPRYGLSQIGINLTPFGTVLSIENPEEARG